MQLPTVLLLVVSGWIGLGRVGSPKMDPGTTLYSTLNISETVRDRDIVTWNDKDLHMPYSRGVISNDLE